MAFPTAINNPVTAAMTQANGNVAGEALAMALGTIYLSLAHSTAIQFQNVVSAQQQQSMLSQAATVRGIIQIYSRDTTAAAGASKKIGQCGLADQLGGLITILNACRQ